MLLLLWHAAGGWGPAHSSHQLVQHLRRVPLSVYIISLIKSTLDFRWLMLWHARPAGGWGLAHSSRQLAQQLHGYRKPLSVSRWGPAQQPPSSCMGMGNLSLSTVSAMACSSSRWMGASPAAATWPSSCAREKQYMYYVLIFAMACSSSRWLGPSP